MTPYPNPERALRAVRCRHDAYLRTLYLTVPRRLALGWAADTGLELPLPKATSAEVLRPVQDHIAQRARRHQARWAPAFERLYLNTQITALDTPTISTA